MKIYAGTSGYSYPQWKGSFYPEDLPNAQMLQYYGERLSTVEINNTFYRLPKTSDLDRWASQVPEDFRFSLKASQKITHFKRLKDTLEETSYLFKTAGTLKERLGVMLFQLPPYFRKDLPRLQEFLLLIPKEARVSFEFRHATWFDDEVFDCLRSRDCALCFADTDEELEVPFVSTASWGYLRLRKPAYSKPDLAKWLKDISGRNWDTAFVFFKHEEEGIGAKLAMQFMDMAEGKPAGRAKAAKRKST